MIEKIKALYGVFKTGQMVANPIAWKTKQVTGGLVAALLGAIVALSKAFGYDIPLDDTQLLEIGGAVVAVYGLFNSTATVVSTDKMGLSPRPDGKTDAAEPVNSPVIPPMREIHAHDPAALQREREPETRARLAEPAPLDPTSADRSFTEGS